MIAQCVFVRVTPDTEPDLLRFMEAANATCNEIAECAWTEQVFEINRIAAAAEDSPLQARGIDYSRMRSLSARVESAFVRNGGKYRPRFDPYAPVPLNEKAGDIEWSERHEWQFSIATLDGERDTHEVELHELLPLVKDEVLCHRTGEYSLVVRFKGEGPDPEAGDEGTFYLAIHCMIPATAASALGLGARGCRLRYHSLRVHPSAGRWISAPSSRPTIPFVTAGVNWRLRKTHTSAFGILRCS